MVILTPPTRPYSKLRPRLQVLLDIAPPAWTSCMDSGGWQRQAAIPSLETPFIDDANFYIWVCQGFSSVLHLGVDEHHFYIWPRPQMSYSYVSVVSVTRVRKNPWRSEWESKMWRSSDLIMGRRPESESEEF